jgi:hypothetical protein
MLQMAEKTTKTKRRALLMAQTEPPAAPSPPRGGLTPAVEPQPLPGDAFERMRMDPEIHQFRRRLVIGAGVVGLIVSLLVFNCLYQSIAENSAMRIMLGADAVKASLLAAKEDASKPAASMIQPEEILPPVTSGNLVFRPQGRDELKTAKRASPKGIASENLAQLAAAVEVLGKFLNASDFKQRALLVRDKLRVAPLMSAFYAKNADGPMTFESILEATEVSPNLSEHVVVFQGGGRRVATVEHTVEGPLVDWESFVGAGEVGWSDFLQVKPTAPALFRVLLSPAGHYENQFGNPAELACYSLRNISEPGAKVVYGYVSKASPMVKELDYWVQESSDATVQMVLKLKFPLDARVDFQVWIQQFVQKGWVIK